MGMAHSWSGDERAIRWPAAAELSEDTRRGEEAVRRASRWLTISGILVTISGIAAILVPAVASVAIAILIGWVLVFAGVAMGIRAFGLRTQRGEFAWRFVEALLALAAGLCILLFPLEGTLTLTFFLTAWLLASGALLLYVAWRIRGLPGVGWLASAGGLSVLLGVLIAVELPSSAAWAIGLLVGVDLVFWGVQALFAARAMRRFFVAG
jgi:uncharacterized membrane protein HdeD (DUF308 family)